MYLHRMSMEVVEGCTEVQTLLRIGMVVVQMQEYLGRQRMQEDRSSNLKCPASSPLRNRMLPDRALSDVDAVNKVLLKVRRSIGLSFKKLPQLLAFVLGSWTRTVCLRRVDINDVYVCRRTTLRWPFFFAALCAQLGGPETV